MSKERGAEAHSLQEATEIIAEETGQSVEEIEKGAEEFSIAPPEAAEFVDED